MEIPGHSKCVSHTSQPLGHDLYQYTVPSTAKTRRGDSAAAVWERWWAQLDPLDTHPGRPCATLHMLRHLRCQVKQENGVAVRL